MWIPIEAVKYVDDDTRRLSKDVSRYFRYEAHREKYGAENLADGEGADHSKIRTSTKLECQRLGERIK